MSTAAQFSGDVYASGNIVCLGLFTSGAYVNDDSVEPGAAIAASKLEHYYRTPYSQGPVTAATDRRVIHVCRGASGVIEEFIVGAQTADIGAATVTVDLKVGGVSVLTATVSLTSATAAYAFVTASILTSALATGNVVEIHITAATAGGGTLPVGLFAQLKIREKA